MTSDRSVSFDVVGTGFTVLDRIYTDGDLLRTAPGITWYESQMQPGDMLHGLSRLALLAMDREGCPLGPNYVAK